jgi:arylsulfatase A-like enzyme
MVGKWHLGHADKKYWPQSRGFEYFTRERGGVIDWQRNGKFIKEASCAGVRGLFMRAVS